ncbi:MULTISPECIES: CRISPR-associated protein Csx18 [unclassified Synechococcus]|uniref:CRISPR-associated protein Csx18 n=1 Tax=unclassified Synechococcus TaxID=2626047 RepID=UPI0021A63A7D|nr:MULTISPECIES: CRISPR-associated protein Csx18 [unclassified Synechococcus]MCT0212417.1 hypothetical protein [Synechococcus sp. CS-1326]MCT0234600.1 hypothetical protein [Synechococcus sp. CS-1327]
MPSPSTRAALLVQGLISLINGAISLVLLLIAPLGLASVITLTLLITASTFCCGLLGRVLQQWLAIRDGKATNASSAGRTAGRSLKPANRWQRLPWQ